MLKNDCRIMLGFYRLGFVWFPAPKGICVNMMSFIMGNILSVPSELRQYVLMNCIFYSDKNKWEPMRVSDAKRSNFAVRQIDENLKFMIFC